MTNKYLIQHGKHSRWEDVDGVQTLVTRKPGDIIEMSLQQAQEKQHSVRLATVEDIAAYEARLRGETDPPATIPDTHVSTAGAPPAPTPATDPLQPPATAEQPPARHFVPPADAPAAVVPAAPVAPEAQHVVVPAAAPAPPAAPAPVSQTQRASDSASAKAENDGKPKARTSNKGTARKTSGARSRSRR